MRGGVIHLELTPDEMRALLALLDVAVRATGLRNAAVAVEFVNKLEAASKAVKQS